MRFLRYHAAVEQTIVEWGSLTHFCAPISTCRAWWPRASILSEGKFFAAAGDASVSVIDVRDIAMVAAAVLTEPHHGGRTYDPTGPDALTHAEMAAHLSDAIGRRITFVDVPSEAMRCELASLTSCGSVDQRRSVS